MSIIAKLTERLDAYAAKMEALEAEVKTLRAMTPLEAFTAGLKSASPEQVAEWFSQCQEIASVFTPSSSAKAPKEKKPVTNATGPTEWNIFVQATWRSMAADAGVLYDDFEGDEAAKDKAFKEASKKVGITYLSAMKEASLRKAASEGRDPEAPKAKAKKTKDASSLAALTAKAAAITAAKKAAAAASSSSSSALALAIEVEEAEDPLAKARAEALEAGLIEVEIEGEMLWHDPTTNTVHNFPQLEAIGEYDAESKAYQAYF